MQGNKTREYFLSHRDAEKILEACPDTQWRLIFALARFGGVRTPSETLLLKWADVNWEKGRMLVHSSKTEHHPGGESRLVPIFPELRPYLMDTFEQAEPGPQWVITRYRKPGLNLRTQLMRILAKAGIKPWPKLWQNLRCTRQTELARDWLEYVVCAWMGNSRLIAREHYLQVTDEHFEQAAHSAAQNPAQYPAVEHGTAVDPTQPGGPENGDLLAGTNASKSLRGKEMGGTGLEHTTFLPPKNAISQTDGAESGALESEKPPADPDLALIVDRWAKLPEPTRQAVLALVRTPGD